MNVSEPQLHLASFAWGIGMGITFGMWLRGMCAARTHFIESSTQRDLDWRRRFSHENTKRPSGPPPLKLRRSTDGYQPRPQQGTPNPPPSEP